MIKKYYNFGTGLLPRVAGENQKKNSRVGQ